MDASNPVQDSTRVTLGSMQKRGLLVRQELRKLQAVARKCHRITYDGLDPYEGLSNGWESRLEGLLKDTRRRWVDQLDRADNSEAQKRLLEVCTPSPPLPVCGLVVDGRPLHPPAQCQKGGKVHKTLQFGGVEFDHVALLRIGELLGEDRAGELLDAAPCRTSGTKEGFYRRCREQLGRPCVQVSTTHTKAQFFKFLDKRLPYDDSLLPHWGDDIYHQMDMLKMSYSSSAGAPYWVEKCDAVEDMMSVIIPRLVDAISQDRLDDLFRQQPELWLCVLKNKNDRYLDPVAKTRPFLSIPFHWSALFSCLSQPFTNALHTFLTKDTSRSAYKFSYAHGGGTRALEYVLDKCKKKGDCTYYVYGDDVDFYYHDGKEILRVCPDFRQMDGSVDVTTINWTIDWIVDAFAKRWGEDHRAFWQSVAEEWKVFATQPMMTVGVAEEGLLDELGGDFKAFQGHSPVWRKINPDGLMTGIVGTTLFDTVKSVWAYELFVEHLKLHPSALNAERASEFFESCGLVIKEGTWKPEKLYLKMTPGAYITSQKFLGVKMMRSPLNPAIIVPTMDLDLWYTMLLTPASTETRKAKSLTARERYLFDRLRGLLVTGGVFQEEFRLFANTVLDMISSEAIVMQVVAGRGQGALPESGLVVGSEFEYPTSMGWPTLEWATDLYAPPEWKKNISMAPVFEEGEKPFRDAYSRPKVEIATAAIDVVVAGRVESSVLVAAPDEDVIPPPPEFADVPSLMVDKVVSLDTSVVPNPRSKIEDVREPKTDRKTLPTIAQVIKERMQPRKTSTSNDETLEGAYQRLLRCAMLRAGCEGEDITQPRWVEKYSNLFALDSTWVQYITHIVSRFPGILSNPMWVQLVAHPLVGVHALATEMGVPARLVEREARELGYLIVGPPDYALISSVPISGMTHVYQQAQEAQIVENDLRLVEAKKDLRAATVEKVARIKEKVSVLKEVTQRAQAPPAQPATEATAAGLPYLARVPSLTVQDRTPQSIRSYVDRILAHGGHEIYSRVVDTSPSVREFYFDKRMVLTLTGYKFKEAWLYFENMIVNKYIRDNPQVLESTQNWADAEEQVYTGLVRLYRTARGPVLIQRPGEPVILVGQHTKLSVADVNGRPGVYFKGPSGTQILSLKSGTALEAVTRLANLLGEEVTVDQEDVPTIINRYPHLKSRISGVRHGRKYKKDPAAPKTEQGKTTYTKAPERSARTTIPHPGREHDQRGSITRSPNDRQRLSRNGSGQYPRQTRKQQSFPQSQSSRVGGYPSGQRGGALAKVAPDRNNDRVHNRRQ